jgi:hypothetical protein
MKSIALIGKAIGEFSFATDTRVDLLIRAALLGNKQKEVCIGFQLVRGNEISEQFWFESRIPAVSICSNFKKVNKHQKICRGRMQNFLESLAKPAELDHSLAVDVPLDVLEQEKASEEILEQIALQHFSESISRISFEAYSSDEEAKVDVYVSYFKQCYLTSIKIFEILPFIHQECFCDDCVNQNFEDFDPVAQIDGFNELLPAGV